MVQVKRTENLKRARVLFKDIKSKQVEIGIFDTATYSDGTSVAYIASIHEYGSATNNILPRSFFRPTINTQKDEWGRQIAGAVKGALAGEIAYAQALNGIGGMAAGDVTKTLSKITSPALKQETINARLRALKTGARAAKGNVPAGFGIEKPLVSSGLLISSIAHKVHSK